MSKNTYLIKYLLLYLGFNLLIIFGNTELCDKCITPQPENQNGWCVPAQYCPVIHNIISIPINRFPANYQTFLKKSKCSNDNTENYCCAESLIDPVFFEESKEFCNLKIDDRDGVKSSTTTITSNIEPFKQPVIIRVESDTSTIDLDNHPNLNLLPNKCGLPGDGDRISNGEITEIDEFPFITLLQYDKNKKDVFQCGGTLINENYVLTAAHCVNSQLFSVRLGEHDLDKETDCSEIDGKMSCNDPVQDIPIEEIHVHKFVGRTGANDIALLRLRKPADVTANNVRFICLPKTTKLRTEEIQRANIAGWGKTEKQVGSNILLKGTVNVNQERQKCVDSYKSTFNININEKYLCAIGARQDTCKGDSGGPLLARILMNNESSQRFVQYGIVSAGPPVECGKNLNYGGSLYTNVPTYMRWILDNIKP